MPGCRGSRAADASATRCQADPAAAWILLCVDNRNGAGDRNRTYNRRVTSALLYRWSYSGVLERGILPRYASCWVSLLQIRCEYG